MKIDSAPVSTPAPMEPVATKGHDGEESQAGSGFQAEITRLTAKAESPQAVTQRGSARTKATSALRNDSPRGVNGGSVLSQLKPDASTDISPIPAIVPVADEDADTTVQELEDHIEWLMIDNHCIVDARMPEAAAKTCETAAGDVPGSGERGGSAGKPDAPAATPSAVTTCPAQAVAELPNADLIVGTITLPSLTEIPQNAVVATVPGGPQAAVTAQSGPEGEPSAKPYLEANPRFYEPTLTNPQASRHVSGTSVRNNLPAGSCDPAEGVSKPLAVGVHAAIPEPDASVAEGTLPTAVVSVKGFPASESTEANVRAPSPNEVQTLAPPVSPLSSAESAVSGMPLVTPRLHQSTGAENAALGAGRSTAGIAAPHSPQRTRTETAASSRTGLTAAARDAVPVSNVTRSEAVLPIRDAIPAAQRSDGWQAGGQSESVDTAAQKAGKEPPRAAGAQRAGNIPAAAPDTLPDRTSAAQPTVGRDSARNIAQPVMPQKQVSARENSSVQNLALGYKQAGETASAAQSRPVSAPTNKLPEFISQLADRLQLQIQRGENQIRIQLRPELLGQLQITAVNGTDGIVGRITTESARVREYLENNLPMLQQNLQDQGLKVDRIEVVLQDSFDARQPNTQQQPLNHSGRGHGGDSSRQSSGVTHVHSHTSPDDSTLDSLSRLTLGPDSTFHTIA